MSRPWLPMTVRGALAANRFAVGSKLAACGLRGRSSIGRAQALQAWGCRFDPGRLHLTYKYVESTLWHTCRRLAVRPVLHNKFGKLPNSGVKEVAPCPRLFRLPRLPLIAGLVPLGRSPLPSVGGCLHTCHRGVCFPRLGHRRSLRRTPGTCLLARLWAIGEALAQSFALSLNASDRSNRCGGHS